MAATYTKLKDGSWGVRSDAKLEKGQQVAVTKRSGETKTEIVRNVLWTDNKVWIAAVGNSNASPAKTGKRQRRGGSYECEECGDYVTPGTKCWETGAIH